MGPIHTCLSVSILEAPLSLAFQNDGGNSAQRLLALGGGGAVWLLLAAAL